MTLGSHSYRHGDSLVYWPDPETHPHHIHDNAEKALLALQATHRASPGTTTGSSTDVLLFPVIQAGQFNIREEEATLKLLFDYLNVTPEEAPSSDFGQRPLVDLTSGYFGLYNPYQDLILASPGVDCRIVAASPKVSTCSRSFGTSSSRSL